MSKLFTLVLVVLALAVPSYAQTVSYTLSGVPQADDDSLRDIITAENERLCTRLNAAGGFSCSQTQACTAAVGLGYVVGGGASCSAAQARNATLNGVSAPVRIWPNASAANREEYLLHRIASPAFQDRKAIIVGWSVIRACITWNTYNTTQKNTVCASYGQANGCQLHPVVCPTP